MAGLFFVWGAVCGFRGYEGELEAEWEQLRQGIGGLGVAGDAAVWKRCKPGRIGLWRGQKERRSLSRAPFGMEPDIGFEPMT